MEVYPKCCVHFDDWTGVDAMQTHRDAGSFKPIVVRKGCYRDQIVPLPIDLSMPLRDLAAWSQAISRRGRRHPAHPIATSCDRPRGHTKLSGAADALMAAPPRSRHGNNRFGPLGNLVVGNLDRIAVVENRGTRDLARPCIF
jgi:hypothetical protein